MLTAPQHDRPLQLELLSMEGYGVVEGTQNPRASAASGPKVVLAQRGSNHKAMRPVSVALAVSKWADTRRDDCSVTGTVVQNSEGRSLPQDAPRRRLPSIWAGLGRGHRSLHEDGDKVGWHAHAGPHHQ